MKGKGRRILAREDLFNVDLSSESLDHNKKNVHHHVAEKCMWLSQRTRADLQLATGFRCARVKIPTVDDWLKLKHALGCMWGTRFLLMIISIDKEGNSMMHIYCFSHFTC